MIKLIKAHYQGDFQVTLSFSDGKEAVFDSHGLLQRSGPSLEPLRNEAYFKRLFIDAGALCWPHGVELSPARLHDTCLVLTPA
jgi:Protein of unknown function (DUF2442)